jgi:hypothetical protein
MRLSISSPQPASCIASHRAPISWRGILPLCAALVLLAGASLLTAQSATTAAPATPIKKALHKRAHAGVSKAAPAETVVAAPVTPAAPPEPEAPHWPVNDKPTLATVTWDSRGLSVQANNSSLEQILNDVATATGATVEGIEKDRRIFGLYGPGLARDVLSQLLQATGYNVVMVGDLGQGAPRQIVLTSRDGVKSAQKGDKKAAKDSDDDDDAEEQPAPPVQPSQPPPPRSPQQLNQEMQRRQALQRNGPPQN